MMGDVFARRFSMSPGDRGSGREEGVTSALIILKESPTKSVEVQECRIPIGLFLFSRFVPRKEGYGSTVRTRTSEGTANLSAVIAANHALLSIFVAPALWQRCAAINQVSSNDQAKYGNLA
jgi:hypothetical protein